MKNFFARLRRNPVLDLDLRTRAREKRLWILALFFLLVPTAQTTLGLVAFKSADLMSAGLTFTLIALFTHAALITLIAPLSAASRISQEREQRTLPSLLNSRLRPADIVWGKLLGAWSFVLWLSSLTLPFLVIGWMAGGLGFWTTLFVFALNCLMGMMLAALALGLSGLFGRTLSAYLATGGVVLLWCVVLPILFVLIGVAAGGPDPVESPLAYAMLYHIPLVPQIGVVLRATTKGDMPFTLGTTCWGVAVWLGVILLGIRAAIHGLRRQIG